MAVFLRQCHFQDLLFYLKSHNLRTEIFPIVWLPRVKCLLLLCIKSEASMNKEKLSLHNFAALGAGGATQRNSSLPQT